MDAVSLRQTARVIAHSSSLSVRNTFANAKGWFLPTPPQPSFDERINLDFERWNERAKDNECGENATGAEHGEILNRRERADDVRKESNTG